jgi:hypothetical protein
LAKAQLQNPSLRGPNKVRGSQSPPADDGGGQDEGLVDVVALDVVRRTAVYFCRLRLFEGGTLTARSVAITISVTCRRLGVPALAVRQKALMSPVAGSASRGGGDERGIIPDGGAAGAGSLAATSDQQDSLRPDHRGCRGRS